MKLYLATKFLSPNYSTHRIDDFSYITPYFIEVNQDKIINNKIRLATPRGYTETIEVGQFRIDGNLFYVIPIQIYQDEVIYRCVACNLENLVKQFKETFPNLNIQVGEIFIPLFNDYNKQTLERYVSRFNPNNDCGAEHSFGVLTFGKDYCKGKK